MNLTTAVLAIVVLPSVLNPLRHFAVLSQNEVNPIHRDEAGPYIVKPSDTDLERKNADIREFLWSHWREQRRGTIGVTWFSKEGLASKFTFILEPDEDGVWSVAVTIDRPARKGAPARSLKYRAYKVERIEAPQAGKTGQALIPNVAAPGRSYRLVLSDGRGQQKTQV